MKRTFFYSYKQEHCNDGITLPGERKTPNYIHGKQFTEQQGAGGEHKSNWDDAIVVHVQEGLSKDEISSKWAGYAIAESYYSNGRNYNF